MMLSMSMMIWVMDHYKDDGVDCDDDHNDDDDDEFTKLSVGG